MRTNRTVSQESISSEITAMLANAPTLTEWSYCWTDALNAGVLSPAQLQCALDTRLCMLFDDAPVNTVRRHGLNRLRVVRVEFRLTDLYRGLSALRSRRQHMRATFEADRDVMPPEVQIYYEEDLDDLELAIAELKQVQRYVASIDLTKRSSIISLGGDPDVPLDEQELVLYALQSLDGHYFFSALQTQAGMQDFYALTCRPENRSAVYKHLAWVHQNIADLLAWFGVPKA